MANSFKLQQLNPASDWRFSSKYWELSGYSIVPPYIKSGVTIQKIIRKPLTLPYANRWNTI